MLNILNDHVPDMIVQFRAIKLMLNCDQVTPIWPSKCLEYTRVMEGDPGRWRFSVTST